jgi:type II secretion system protein J
VELVVAGVVAALLAVATAGSLSTILKARGRAEAREAAFSRAELAAARIARDVQSIARDPDLRHSHLSIRGSGGAAARDELLVLTRSITPLRTGDEPEGGLYEVQYRVIEEAGTVALWRRMDPAFDPAIDGGGIAVPLVRGVRELRLEASDGAAWFAQWNSDSDGLPHALRVTVVAADDGGGVLATSRRVIAVDRVPLPPAEEETSPTTPSGGGAR